MASEQKAFFEATAERKTVYALGPESPIPDSRIKEIIDKAVHDTPSSFNSQTTRLVVALGDKHRELWDTITEVYKSFLPEDKFEHAKGRFDGFRAGYGTILFYEDLEQLKVFQEKFATYKDKFPQWSEHTSAMHQYVLWTAFTVEGLGCNLQHYNPPIDDPLAEKYKLPKTWNLKAQLVFGKPLAGRAMERTYEPIEKRVVYV